MHKYARKRLLLQFIDKYIYTNSIETLREREINTRVKICMDKTLNRIMFQIYISETNNISSIVCVTKRLLKESENIYKAQSITLQLKTITIIIHLNLALVFKILYKEILIDYMIQARSRHRRPRNFSRRRGWCTSLISILIIKSICSIARPFKRFSPMVLRRYIDL